MIAVDTNVVVRLLTRDDEKQFQKALALFTKESIFIPDTVILETEWVLRFAYDFKTSEICDAFTKLFGMPNVKIPSPDRISLAIELARQGLDFADALHLALSQNCDRLATFDSKFILQAKGLTKCKVSKP